MVVSVFHTRLNGASTLKGQELEIKLQRGKKFLCSCLHSSGIFRAPALFLAMCWTYAQTHKAQSQLEGAHGLEEGVGKRNME